MEIGPNLAKTLETIVTAVAMLGMMVATVWWWRR